MSWVGYAVEDEAKQVRPVAHAGFENGYLGLVEITWGEDVRGLGPLGQSIRTGLPVINRATQFDSNYYPWREEALKRGYQSVHRAPFTIGAQTFGALFCTRRSPTLSTTTKSNCFPSWPMTQLRNRYAPHPGGAPAGGGAVAPDAVLAGTCFRPRVLDGLPRPGIVYANTAACRSLGRSQEELLSLSIPDINPTVSPKSGLPYGKRSKYKDREPLKPPTEPKRAGSSRSR